MTEADRLEKLLERGAVLLEPQGVVQPTEYGKRYLTHWAEYKQKWGPVWRDIHALAEKQMDKWDEIATHIKLTEDPVMVASGITHRHDAQGHGPLRGQDRVHDARHHRSLPRHGRDDQCHHGRLGERVHHRGRLGLHRVHALHGHHDHLDDGGHQRRPDDRQQREHDHVRRMHGRHGDAAGFLIVDTTTINTGNALFFGQLTSTVISTTQTPPTIAAAAMSLSLAAAT